MIKIIQNIENQLKKDFKPSSLTVIDNTHLHKTQKFPTRQATFKNYFKKRKSKKT